MHRDIEMEVARCLQPNLGLQQAALDVWREEFNWQRPHEKLEGRCPGEVYQKSSRPLPVPVPPLEYGQGFFVRKIMRNGALRWKGTPLIISTALAGWHVGLRYIDTDHFEVYFSHLLLGQIELSTRAFVRAASVVSQK